jgi:hypothetical protein
VSFATASTSLSQPASPRPVVAYGTTPSDLPWEATAVSAARLTDNMATPLWLYDVLLTGLEHGTTYHYRAGGAASSAPLYNFTLSAPAVTLDAACVAAGELAASCTRFRPRRIAAIADMGLANSVSVPALTAAAVAGSFDLVLHAGAYNLTIACWWRCRGLRSYKPSCTSVMLH